MTRRKLTLFLAVTAIALQSDIAHGFPSKRHSPDHMELGTRNSVDTPEGNMYRLMRQMDALQRQYSQDSQVDGEIYDLENKFGPEVREERDFGDQLRLIIDRQRGEIDNSALRDFSKNENPLRQVTFVTEDEPQGDARMRNPSSKNTDNDLDRMGTEDKENPGETNRAEEKNTFRELECLRQQELLQEAIRQEEILQDSTVREASTLHQISVLRGDDPASDPLQQFKIARDAFIYKEEIRQKMLQEQALRQEVLRQEALRQERAFQGKPDLQETTLRQESEILNQLIRQEEVRQENAKNLEKAYREEAIILQDYPDRAETLLQKAQFQENLRQESAKRQEVAIRQNELLRMKRTKRVQQLCINCGPKIVAVSNGQNITV